MRAHLTAFLVATTLWGATEDAARRPVRISRHQERVPTELVASTQDSRLEERARIVIRDPAQWARYGELLGIATARGAATPAVDFERDMVILVAMGRKPTGGYGVEVSQVVRGETSLSVTVTETIPGRSCMTTQAFTAPAAAVRVPRFAGEVRFTETQRTRECG